MWPGIVALGLLATGTIVNALGEPRVISFPDLSTSDFELEIQQNEGQQISFTADDSTYHRPSDFVIASRHHHYAAPLLLDSKDNVAIHIAAQTFAEDVYRVTGVRPRLYNDTLPKRTRRAIVVGSLGSALIDETEAEGLQGKWESYDVRVKKAVHGADEDLVITGSDRVSDGLEDSYRSVWEPRADESLREELFTVYIPCLSRWASHHGTSGLTYRFMLNPQSHSNATRC